MSEATKTQEGSKRATIVDLPVKDKELVDSEKKQLKGGMKPIGETDCSTDQHTTGSTSCDTVEAV